MNAVLRITLTYFSIVPLQKWLSITAALLIAVALLTQSFPFAILAFLGAVLIVLVPTFLGGASMRYGSSGSTLQLRPGSRWKMLAAALLTVCLMTLICVATLWATVKTDMAPPGSNLANAPIPPTGLALVLWGGFTLVWMISFTASANRFWGIVLVVAALMGPSKWKLLEVLGSPPIVLASAGAVYWLVFAFWYLRVRRVRRPGWGSSNSPALLGENNTGGWYSSLTESKIDSRAVALRAYLLGTTSRRGMLLPGLITIVIILPFLYFQRRSGASFVTLPVVFLTIFAGLSGSLTYMITRRARSLWLRAGLDRSGLFALSERIALQSVALMLISAAVVLAGISIAVTPELRDRILVFVLAQLAYAMVMFYFGLSQTYAFSAATVAAYIGLGLGLIVQMIPLLPQSTGFPPIVAPILIGISVVLALMLRGFARDRWLSLDWHLTRPAVMRRDTP